MCDSLIKDETIIIASHLIDEIENFIDRAILIKRGEIEKDVLIEDMQNEGKNLEYLMKETFGYDEDRIFYNAQ